MCTLFRVNRCLVRVLDHAQTQGHYRASALVRSKAPLLLHLFIAFALLISLLNNSRHRFRHRSAVRSQGGDTATVARYERNPSLYAMTEAKRGLPMPRVPIQRVTPGTAFMLILTVWLNTIALMPLLTPILVTLIVVTFEVSPKLLPELFGVIVQ